MDHERPAGDDTLSPTRLIEINRICDRFEAAWRGGRRPAAEDHLGEAAGPARSALLGDLLATELECRRSLGERPAVAEYRARFPDDIAAVDAAFVRAGLPLAPPDSGADTGQNLLFGLLALQNNFIDRDALLAAFNTWVANKSRTLGDILLERGALDAPRHVLLAALVGEHLRQHGGDPERSLAELAVGGSTRESLKGVGDPDIDASLERISTLVPASGGDLAAAFAVGTSTAQGRRFRVLRPHAKGGLGSVFVALDAELNREVALKEILSYHADNPLSRQRFLVEAEITGGLEHPGIVPVYGLGTYADGRPYYAMRFIKGDSLKEAIASFHADQALKSDLGRRSLALSKLLRRFLDVCNAIDYAHSRGVLHRDIKPGNIIVGKYGETLVVDWGLAKSTGHREPGSPPDERTLVPSSSGGSGETLPGAALGTPAYMSPEQAAGDVKNLGPRSDVYGLGATLYSLLTGRAPVSSGEANAVLRAVQEGRISPPRSLDPTIDRALEAVCLKAMSKRSEDRYPTARALAEDVERWLADEPVSAWREPVFSRAMRWVRKHQTLATTTAALVVFGLIGFAVAYRREVKHSGELARANSELAAANKESERWLGETFQSMEDYYTFIGENVLRERSDLADVRRMLLEKPRRFYERLTTEYAGSRPEDDRANHLLARGRSNLSRVLSMLGEHEKALEQIQSSVNLFEQLVTRHPKVSDYRYGLSEGYNQLGRIYVAFGRMAQAEAALTKAIVASEELVSRHPDIADYRFGLAVGCLNSALTLGRNSRFDESEVAVRKAIAAFEVLVGRQSDSSKYRAGLASGYSALGGVFRARRQLTESEEALTKAIAAYETLVAQEPNVPDYQNRLASAYDGLGGLLGSTGRAAEAEFAWKKATAVYEALVAQQPNVPEFQNRLARSYTGLGAAFGRARRLDESEGATRKAIAAYEALVALRPKTPEFQSSLGLALSNLGDCEAARGRHGEAVPKFRRAIDLLRPLFNHQPQVLAYNQYLADAYKGLAASLRALGQVDLSVDVTRERIKCWPRKADQLYDAACALALCIPISGNSSRQHSLVVEATATLHAAIAAGWSNGAWMSRDADLVSIRGHDDFRRMVVELMDRAMPADPIKR
jgi:eukaryotic-like serine/threonine-protein kinase